MTLKTTDSVINNIRALIKDTPDFFEKSQYSRILLIMSKSGKINFVDIFSDSSSIFEPSFWGAYAILVFKIGHTGGFRSKIAVMGKNP